MDTIWIGLKDIGNGKFYWVESRLEVQDWAPIWALGSPKKTSGRCVVFDASDGFIRNVNCNQGRRYSLCQKSSSV